MADEDSQPKGLESLLQTLDPERQEILLFILEQDHQARLGAELVGPRAFSPKSTGPSTVGWTSRHWGDITLSEEPPGSSVHEIEQKILDLASESLQQVKEHPERENWRARQQASEKAELEANSKETDQIQADFMGSEMTDMDLEKYFTGMEANQDAHSKILEKYSGATFPKGPPSGDYRTEAEKLLYKDGILQPFVLFDRQTPGALNPESKAHLFQEMLVLSHELGHVGDVWLTDHRADMDAEFTGHGGVLDNYRMDHPRLLTMKEMYKSGPGKFGRIVDEPYSRLMDRYNRERLFKKGFQPPTSGEKEKLGYIPDRYQRSVRTASEYENDRQKGRKTGRDPFATGYSTGFRPEEVESRDAAGHPAQGGALMELNKLSGRGPLEGMDAWLQKHGRYPQK